MKSSTRFGLLLEAARECEHARWYIGHLLSGEPFPRVYPEARCREELARILDLHADGWLCGDRCHLRGGRPLPAGPRA